LSAGVAAITVTEIRSIGTSLIPLLSTVLLLVTIEGLAQDLLRTIVEGMSGNYFFRFVVIPLFTVVDSHV